MRWSRGPAAVYRRRAVWYRRGVRIAGWLLVGAIAVTLAQAGSAVAAPRPDTVKGGAVEVYVEEFPTVTGSTPADAGAIAVTAGFRRAGSSGNGGLIGLAIVLAGVTAAVLIAGRRSRRSGS